jgi:hypothetical protein
LHLAFNFYIIPYITMGKETIKNPMDSISNDPITILKELPTADILRNHSTKFSELLTKNPELCKGHEEELGHNAIKALSDLDTKIADSTNTGYAIYSKKDVLTGLRKVNHPAIKAITDKYNDKGDLKE